MAPLQHRGSSKSPVNEINLSRANLSRRRYARRPQGRICAYAMRATDNIFGAPRPHRGICGPRDTIICQHSWGKFIQRDPWIKGRRRFPRLGDSITRPAKSTLNLKKKRPTFRGFSHLICLSVGWKMTKGKKKCHSRSSRGDSRILAIFWVKLKRDVKNHLQFFRKLRGLGED